MTIGKGGNPSRIRTSIHEAHVVGQAFPEPEPMTRVEAEIADALAEEKKEKPTGDLSL